MRSKYCRRCGEQLGWFDRMLVRDLPEAPGLDRHPPKGLYRCPNCGWSGRPERKKG